MKQYDFLIVGSGLFGAVFAYKAMQQGKSCLVIDKRNHVGGNTYCDKVEDINIHTYGAHIFHTSDAEVWKFVNQFVKFNHFVNSPIANYKGELYNLPFNMNTFYQLWKVKTPKEAEDKIKEQQGQYADIDPKNLEEQALKLAGKDIYQKLIKEYTEKQWGCNAKDLPAFIIKRLPFRFTFDNNYFNDTYQGIPIGGYNPLTEKLLKGADILLNTDFFANRDELKNKAKTIVYTGMLDTYFDYCYGNLEYRSLKFETETLDTDNFQGNAVINYTDAETPFTRIIEHKHFEFGSQPRTVITKEYPQKWDKTKEAYYPINNEKNDSLAEKYKDLAGKEKNVIFGGRLADYKYYDMDKVIRLALDTANKYLNK
ncbi:UDP-galactopyranose mutase [Paludibacter sp. 221]|uniref:UDP-galactopyranose mutase n=1 Tax=Paludibacter sp. 221 TaxID=2302939 RepID=UPI0013D1B003|nr:UDP-galactopyranose mutase [Paludibacter sp. 221]NDV47428.1 UDP-galactopyranose mutase [Paludibacter sp. 221]